MTGSPSARRSCCPSPYFHVVFTLPAPIAEIAYQNKAAIYHLLFKASAETVLTIAADPKHLGARIGISSVLHTWGSTMTHHPHLHMIVPGGGISRDRQRWVSVGPRFLLAVPVLSRLFRGLFWPSSAPPTRPVTSSSLASTPTSMTPERSRRIWRRCARSSGTSTQSLRSADPKVLAYLSRYTHRVAISNRRLIASNHNGVTFRYKDYRADGRARYKVIDAPARTSSSAAFSSTSCRTASTASATTDCLPIATARPISHAPASCSRCRLA